KPSAPIDSVPAGDVMTTWRETTSNDVVSATGPLASLCVGELRAEQYWHLPIHWGTHEILWGNNPKGPTNGRYIIVDTIPAPNGGPSIAVKLDIHATSPTRMEGIGTSLQAGTENGLSFSCGLAYAIQLDQVGGPNVGIPLATATP